MVNQRAVSNRFPCIRFKSQKCFSTLFTQTTIKLEEVKRTKQSICFQKFIYVVDFASLSCGNILVKIPNAPDKCLYNTVPSSNYFDRDND